MTITLDSTNPRSLRGVALAAQAACEHTWGTPVRAPNRFGRPSAHLYGTTCTRCGKQEVRAGLARLKREVVDA